MATMKKLEIITHCWRYPSLLTWYLSSFDKAPRVPSGWKCDITLWVSSDAMADPRTSEVVSAWLWRASSRWPCSLRLDVVKTEPRFLCRRAIGRNFSAMRTSADWVWFSDVDYLVSECFAGLFSQLDSASDSLIYPRVAMGTSHASGDKLIQMASDGDIDYSAMLSECDWAPHHYDRAIGGIQFVRGDICRKFGYLPGTQFQKPVGRWMRTHEDTAFRTMLGTDGTPFDLPGLRRIRHSRCGRKMKGLTL